MATRKKRQDLTQDDLGPEVPVEVIRKELDGQGLLTEVDNVGQTLPVSHLLSNQTTCFAEMLTDEFTTTNAVELLLNVAEWLSDDDLERLTLKFSEVRGQRYHKYVFGEKKVTKPGMNSFLKRKYEASQDGEELIDYDRRMITKSIQYFRKEKGWELFIMDRASGTWLPCSMSAVLANNRKNLRFKVYPTGDRSTSLWSKQGLPYLAME